METKIWRMASDAEPSHRYITGAGEPPNRDIMEAAELLHAGKLVAFPTETVYGLGADARSTEAVESVFRAKGRPSDNPLIVHISDVSQLDELIDGPPSELALRLAARFWPGPLTLVLPARPGAVSEKATAGLSTVAIRMPAHPLALALISAAGCPVAAPSANRSGRPSPTTARHVLTDLNGRIDGVLDGGPCGVGLESTVVELTPGGGVHVLRPGAITTEQLRIVAGTVTVEPDHSESGAAGQPAGDTPNEAANHLATELAPRSPGMKYAHYAPQGELTVVRGSDPSVVTASIREAVAAARAKGRITGVLAPAEHAAHYDADVVIVCGSLTDLAAAARDLYGALRAFDEAGATHIFAEAYPEEGVGAALMNRLTKAAGRRVLQT